MASVLRFDDWETTLGTGVVSTDGSGNVAVGGSSPSYKLDVTGDINASGDVRVGGDSLPRGQLAIATDDADFTATTSGIDVVNTSVTLTSSRILKITFFVGAIDNPSTNLQIAIDLRSGPVGTSSDHYASSSFAMGTASDSNIGTSCGVYSATFAAGTHDFYVRGTTSTGTCRINGATVRLHTLIVEDVGEG